MTMLSRPNKFCKIDQETDLICMQRYKDGESLTQIANDLGINRACLSKRLQKAGLTLRPNRLRSLDIDYFAEITDEHKAYWLGFLSADGSITRTHVSVALKAEDQYMLQILRLDLNSDTHVQEKIAKCHGFEYPAARICFCSKKMVQDLAQYNCIPCKSAIIRVPFDKIPNDLMRHYIRGYYDGNGSMHIGPKYIPSQVSVAIGTGSEQMAHDIQSILTDINVISTFRIGNERNTYFEVAISNTIGKERFFSWIYKDATVFLGRKHNLYMQFAVMKKRRIITS